MGGLGPMTKSVDPIELGLFKSLSIPSRRRWARRCGVLRFRPTSKSGATIPAPSSTAQASVVAMGDHMPVHLGSMPMSVRAVVDTLDLEPGDIAMLNDPYAAERICPTSPWWCRVYAKRDSRAFYVANRAHHCRRRRDLSRLDGPLPRDLSGRPAHSAGENHPRRARGSRCAGTAFCTTCARRASAKAI